MTYYPMVWGGNPNEENFSSCQERIPGCDMIIAYNEPNLTASANTDTWVTVPHVKSTTDVTGILELCDFYAVGNWVEYRIEAANSGRYEMLLRYANPIDGEFTLDIDGTKTTISLPKTGDETKWRTASVPVQITAGKHTVRLTLDKGRANFNWFCFR